MKLCECGCGQPAPIANRTRRSIGHVRGEPVRFICGHSAYSGQRIRAEEGSAWEVVDGGFDSPCWRWLRATHPRRGYGIWTFAGEQYAHRSIYRALGYDIPEGMQLDHLCANSWCVRPEHLEPVTNAENCRRGRATKLTRDDVNEIRRSLPYATDRELGERFGVTKQAISLIRRGKNWVAA